MPAVSPRPHRALIRDLTAALEAVADPGRAPQQQAYMKSEMPYLGVAAPDLHRACRETFKKHVISDADVWQATAGQLWRKARFREYRYAAVELLGYRRYRPFYDPDLMDLLEEFIVTGAWWDHVDAIAINLVGALLAQHPRVLKPRLARWSKDQDIWRRRTSIIAQLKFKSATDTKLLIACIEPSVEESEFFLRKAIGWALREYSKTDPQLVIDYVTDNAHRLSGLSKREGLKVLLKQGLIDQIP